MKLTVLLSPGARPPVSKPSGAPRWSSIFTAPETAVCSWVPLFTKVTVAGAFDVAPGETATATGENPLSVIVTVAACATIVPEGTGCGPAVGAPAGVELATAVAGGPPTVTVKLAQVKPGVLLPFRQSVADEYK